MTENIEYLINLRRVLHSIPEISGHEKETAVRIVEFLKTYQPSELITGVGGNGIVAVWDSKIPGPVVIFRADMDALPIDEVNDFAYKSLHPGVSHKCGHDGHMAVLCALAVWLSENNPPLGKVCLLFQPSEENGMGAQQVINNVRFAALKPDYVFAMHNVPGLPLHSVIIREGDFTAAVKSIIINLFGKTSHASEPENGINPAGAVAEILKECHALEVNDPNSEMMQLVTPVYVLIGEKTYGTSPGNASVHFTLRCRNNMKLEHLRQQIERLSAAIAVKHQLAISYDECDSFQAIENDADCVQLVSAAAEAAGLMVITKNSPFKWGEDFGLFTSEYKGCMFGLGAGENCPALHSPDYDFPDELIETAIRLYNEILKQLLFSK